MELKLRDLLKFDDIVIQTHDNPDADAISSGFALYSYLKKNDKNVRLVYGGKFPVSKSNLVLMIDTLGIPIEYVTGLDTPELLVTVDCQYGESNVTLFEAKNIAVIDHHQISGTLPEMSYVRPKYGACATVVWQLLEKENMDINEDVNLATALYYGLLTDTNGFSELNYPADKDLRDFAKIQNSFITLFRNSNLSLEELKIAGEALKNSRFEDEYRFAIVEAKPCDPNILGIISDMVLEVDTVDCCLVYSVMEFGVKISVRSCVKEVQASELAAYIADGIGGGGGHLIKAGGFLKRDLIEKLGIQYLPETLLDFLKDRMTHYFADTDIYDTATHMEDITKLSMYQKLPLKVGYVRCKDFIKEGTKITVRTLEGDIEIVASDNTYIVIGIEGEIYPINKEKFERGYNYSEEEYQYPADYPPTVVVNGTGDRIELLPYAKTCIANGGGRIYARELTQRVKVFTEWDKERYYLGKPGDYVAVRLDDLHDFYIIARNVFFASYESVE